MGSAVSKYVTLCSPPEFLSNNSLFWHTDNFAASKIVESGSSKSKLQTKAVKKRKKKLFMSANEKYKPQYLALVQRAMGKLIECDDNI